MKSVVDEKLCMTPMTRNWMKHRRTSKTKSLLACVYHRQSLRLSGTPGQRSTGLHNSGILTMRPTMPSFKVLTLENLCQLHGRVISQYAKPPSNNQHPVRRSRPIALLCSPAAVAATRTARTAEMAPRLGAAGGPAFAGAPTPARPTRMDRTARRARCRRRIRRGWRRASFW